MIVIQLLFIQILIFGALVAILRYVLKRHVGSASSHIQELTQECTRKLVDAKKRMDEANDYYNSTVAHSKEEGEHVKQQLVQEGQKDKENLLQQGRKQGEETTHRAQIAAENLVNEQEKRIDARAAEKTLEIIQQLLPGKMSEETHSHWVGELIQSGLDGLKRLNIPEDVPEVQVFSAFPLKPEERNLLRDRLSEMVGKTIHLEEEVNPQLILGLRFTMGRLVIDGTLQFKIHEFLKNAQHASNS